MYICFAGGVDYSVLDALVSIDSATNGDRLFFEISIVDDNLVEMSETIDLLVTTTDTNARISPDTALVVIFDNDGALINISWYSLAS